MIRIVVSNRAHGQTHDNVAGIASGWREPVLTEQGRSQARESGLGHAQEHFDVIFTSDHKRTYKTALLMFEGRDIPIVQDRRLRTLNYGDLEGLPVAEWEELRPKDILKEFPNGESYAQMADRFRSFLQDLEANHDGKKIMIIAPRPRIFEHLIRVCPSKTQANVGRGLLTPWSSSTSHNLDNV